MSQKPYSTLEEAYHADAIIQRGIDQNWSKDHLIVILANEHRRLQERVMELEVVAAKRYQLPDGSIRIWHCPDHLIPLTKL